MLVLYKVTKVEHFEEKNKEFGWKMPGLTNESETHQGIIDQQAQNGSSSSTATAAESSNSARYEFSLNILPPFNA